ncbi:MAG: chorismate lyase [Gammaproteobacteria bacterium]|nr:MAG: chorismate lyase [Gammaproteobacteria bacterium]
MPVSPTSEPRWHQQHCAPYSLLNGVLRSWLLDRGSLTERLVRLSQGHFRVQILHQGMARPRPSEVRTLGMGQRQQALIREVILLGHDSPWVYARSVIPHSSLTGRLRSLRKLDTRPLGALLFSDPHMERGPIELAYQDTRSTPLPAPLQDLQAVLAGRRSLFWLDDKPLLVCEMFLPDFPPSTPYNNPL